MTTRGDLNYNQTVTSTEAKTLQFYTNVYSPTTGTNAGKTLVDYYVNYNDAAVSQVESVTIDPTVASANAYYSVKIVGTTTTATYVFLSLTADTNTNEEVAAALAPLINTHPDVVATSAAAIVTITGAVPGAAFTCTVDCRSKADDSVIASKITKVTTTAASGTVKTGLMFSMATHLSVDSNLPKLNMGVTAYDGASSTPVQLGSPKALSTNSSKTMTAYLA